MSRFMRRRGTIDRNAIAFALVLVAGCASLKKCAYEGFGRDERQKPDQVIAALAIEPGERVADLGAGGGYFTFRLADAVGPEGRVFAVDIDPDMTAFVANEARERGAANVEVVLAEPDDPKLPPGGVDLVFTSNTYHHIADRVVYFRDLRRSLSPRGRVAILDYDEDAGGFAGCFGHATPRATVEREMNEAGYRLVAAPSFLEGQTFLVFAPSPGAAASPG